MMGTLYYWHQCQIQYYSNVCRCVSYTWIIVCIPYNTLKHTHQYAHTSMRTRALTTMTYFMYPPNCVPFSYSLLLSAFQLNPLYITSHQCIALCCTPFDILSRKQATTKQTHNHATTTFTQYLNLNLNLDLNLNLITLRTPYSVAFASVPIITSWPSSSHSPFGYTPATPPLSREL